MQRDILRIEPVWREEYPLPISASFVRLDRNDLECGRKVVDKTGLKGTYHFTLQWTPDESEPFKGITENGVPGSAPEPDSSAPSVFTAVHEQLGLKLDSQKAPVDVLVIAHVEKPSEN